MVDSFNIASMHHAGRAGRNCPGCHLAYEGAFAQAMRYWEWFVKEVVIDLMAGAQTAHRTSNCVPNFPHLNRAAARNELLRSRISGQPPRVTLRSHPGDYLLLHRPSSVVMIVQYWLTGSTVEQTFAGNSQDIERIVHIRHGLAHGTRHSQFQAQAALLALDPLSYYSTIGEFLAARDATGTTWLETIFDRLADWAIDMSP
jgi:hypothetical protein